MIKFLITALIVIVCVFFIAVLLCLMIWVITKLLRFLFPQRFGPGAAAPKKKPKKKFVRQVVENE